MFWSSRFNRRSVRCLSSFLELKRRVAELYVHCYISTLKWNKCIRVYDNLLCISAVRLSRLSLVQKSTMQTNINHICLHFIRFFFLYCSFTRQINCVMLPCRRYYCCSVCGSVVPTISLIKSCLAYDFILFFSVLYLGGGGLECAHMVQKWNVLSMFTFRRRFCRPDLTGWSFQLLHRESAPDERVLLYQETERRVLSVFKFVSIETPLSSQHRDSRAGILSCASCLS